MKKFVSMVVTFFESTPIFPTSLQGSTVWKRALMLPFMFLPTSLQGSTVWKRALMLPFMFLPTSLQGSTVWKRALMLPFMFLFFLTQGHRRVVESILVTSKLKKGN
ncbi:hypothetical protein AMTR_s00153p00016460 [Amborella trichopoda]|uniref:Uncharacterized protein n=1 Tax=Amborella trichopoda TaxID=13333 RepID=W1PMN7_AMBTC|nr:hypothetical protein AMTR_s00153p00016460 [Amborella trichopoda]